MDLICIEKYLLNLG